MTRIGFGWRIGPRPRWCATGEDETPRSGEFPFSSPCYGVAEAPSTDEGFSGLRDLLLSASCRAVAAAPSVDETGGGRREFLLTGAIRATGLVGVVLVVSASAAVGQSLAQRVARTPDGVVRFGFAARPGVWGDRRGFHFRRSTGEWESTCTCASDVIRVALSRADGRVTDVRTYVGGRWRPAAAGVTHLGRVGSIEAADYLLELVPRVGGGDAAEEAILGAVLADRAVVWRRLLRFARNRALRQDVREKAIFWLGQAASAAATAGLETIVRAGAEERELREHAIFALSQRPVEQGVPALIRVVRTNPDPELKAKALFWLGQSGDPRAVALFEEILTRR